MKNILLGFVILHLLNSGNQIALNKKTIKSVYNAERCRNLKPCTVVITDTNRYEVRESLKEVLK